MRTTTRVTAGLLLALGVGYVALPARGGDEQESEAKAIARIAKAFNKLKSYAMTVDVDGGQAIGAEHRITKPSVRKTYRAVVHGGVCKVEAPEAAFRARLGAGGAIQNGTRWQGLLATDEGRLLERLFVRPEALLAECVKLKGAARWVEPEGGVQAAPPPADDVPTFEEEGGDERTVTDGTKERDGKKSKGLASQAPVSNHLRITAPPTIAIEHFTRIQNSGCFAEG